jgi:HAD superfamily hydrolase (TIGR01509 family)
LSIKAIIFDVDGTLADTEEAHRIAFNQAFAENGLDWRWDVARYDQLLSVTGGKERIRHYVQTHCPALARRADYDAFVRHLHQTKTGHYNALLQGGGVPLRPGIRQLIEAAGAAGIRLAIATTTTPENVATLLGTTLGQDWRSRFASIGCGDIVPDKKPAPDIYHWVLNDLGLAANDCIALEDSSNGLAASLAANIRTWITRNDYTRHQDFTGAAGVFDDLADLDDFYRQAGLENLSAG